MGLRCLMLGHEDRIHRIAGRMYLECIECGRATPGWDISPHAEPPTPCRQSQPRTRFYAWSAYLERWAEFVRTGFQLDLLRRIIH
jgi:hypothetical protein